MSCGRYSLLHGLFSSWREWVLLSSCSAGASHCSVFSCCGELTLGQVGFSSCGSWPLKHRLNSCDTWVQILCSMWDSPGSGIEPMSPVLTGRSFITRPPKKHDNRVFLNTNKVSLSCWKMWSHLILCIWSYQNWGGIGRKKEYEQWPKVNTFSECTPIY